MKITQSAYEICIAGILRGQSKQDIYTQLNNCLDQLPTERTYRNWLIRAESALTDAGYIIDREYTDTQIADIVRQLKMPEHGNLVRPKIQQRIIDEMMPDGYIYNINTFVKLLSHDYSADQVRHAFWDLQLHRKVQKAPSVRTYCRRNRDIINKNANTTEISEISKEGEILHQKIYHYVFLSCDIVDYNDLGLSDFKHDSSIKLICLYYGYGMIDLYPTLKIDKETIMNFIKADVKHISKNIYYYRSNKPAAYRVFISEQIFETLDLLTCRHEKGLNLRFYGLQSMDRDDHAKWLCP